MTDYHTHNCTIKHRLITPDEMITNLKIIDQYSSQ